MEIWDAYDEKLNKIEGMTLVRGEEVPDGVFHLVCEIIVKHVLIFKIILCLKTGYAIYFISSKETLYLPSITALTFAPLINP